MNGTEPNVCLDVELARMAHRVADLISATEVRCLHNALVEVSGVIDHRLRRAGCRRLLDTMLRRKPTTVVEAIRLADFIEDVCSLADFGVRI